jgi:hypothetical protein
MVGHGTQSMLSGACLRCGMFCSKYHIGEVDLMIIGTWKESNLVKAILYVMCIVVYVCFQGWLENDLDNGIVYCAVVLPSLPPFIALWTLWSNKPIWFILRAGFVTWIVWDVVGINYWIIDFIAYATGDWINPQWVSIALIAFALICLLASLLWHRMTLYRVVFAGLLVAQLSVLVLFHIATIHYPMLKDRQIAEQRVAPFQGMAAPEILEACPAQHFTCYAGTMEEVIAKVKANHTNPGFIIKTIKNVQSAQRMWKTWFETGVPGSTDQLTAVRYVTVQKQDGIYTLILDENDAPIRFYVWMIGFSILSIAFHLAWLFLVPYVCLRHGNWLYQNRKWRKMPLR